MMVLIRCRTRKLSRGGATLVEFAITLPIVFLLFFGMIELSRLFMLQHSADTAAYEGARNAIVPGAKPQDAVLAASELLRAAGIKNGQIVVQPDVITEETALITVTTVIPLSDNGWVVPNFFGGRIVKSEVTLICERPPMIMLTGIPRLRLNALQLNLDADDGNNDTSDGNNDTSDGNAADTPDSSGPGNSSSAPGQQKIP